MRELPKIRALASTMVIGLECVVDMPAIMKRANERIERLAPAINVHDLGEWRLLVSLVFNHGAVIGIGKRCITCASDKEKEWSIGIPVPDLTQASYGLRDKHFVRAGIDRRSRFHDPVDARFDDYPDLQSCIAGNVLRGLEAAFARGVMVAGRRIKSTCAPELMPRDRGP